MRKPSPRIARTLKTLPVIPFFAVSLGLGAQTIAPPPTSSTHPAVATTAAQTQQQASQVRATPLAAELTKSINSKKAKTGDEIDAKTISDATLPNGTTLPKGTKLIGNVVEVTPKSKDQKNSHLVFSLNRAVMKDGQDVPIHAAVTSVTAPVLPQSADAPMQPGSMSSGAASAPSSASGGGSAPSAPAPTMPTMAAAESQQGAVLKSAQDRVPVGGMPHVILSAPTTPQSAGVLDAENENISLESGTKFTVNITPADAGM